MKCEEIALLIILGLIIFLASSVTLYYFIFRIKLKKYEKLHPAFFNNLEKHNKLMSKSCDFWNKKILPLKNKIKSFEDNKLYYTKERLIQEENNLENLKKELEPLEQEYQKMEDEINNYYLLMKQEIDSDIKFKNFMVKNDFWREEE